ncbi:hypothetical protein [Bacillus testis]|uniref:hypothetical protein n=1 Tax=Bacillus testis TaxID=1622072 RepID=UPI00067EB1D1|nr:hypothetical protein [Bacillus testis]
MEDQRTKKGKLFENIIWGIVTLIILGWTILKFMDGNGTKGFMGILTVLALFAIAAYQWKCRSAFPSVFASMTYAFIFVSVGLGTFGGMYSVNHFDDFLHVTSGIWLGYGAWLVMNYMIGQERAESLPKPFIAFYIIVCGLAIAGAWELMEFAGDQLFSFTAQGRDPKDTMFDMIDGLCGATIMAFILIRKHGNNQSA